MAIPGTPNNFNVQSANQQILVSWDLSPGATSYIVQRSLDNVTFLTITTISGSPLATSYVDTAVTLATQYWYQVAASNTSGTSNYTTSQAAVPAPTGEMSLGQLRLQAQQRADLVNSQMVTLTEWNRYINQAMFELYDILVTVYEDYFMAIPAQFTLNGTDSQYPVPDGTLTFINSNTQQSYVAPAFYKLLGVDLAVQSATNAWVTLNKFNFIDRNTYVYPNSTSTIYGVFNCQYRLMGNNIQFIPTPSGQQTVRLWYIPRVKELLADTDTTTIGISGWAEYVIVRAAKYALDKEESDTSKLGEELLYLKTRIEGAAPNRDAGQPDKISNTRRNTWGNGSFNNNGGNFGSIGGF